MRTSKDHSSGGLMGARTLFIFCILASLATGILNPGPGAIPIQKASLEPKGWIVHFEVDLKNAAGQTVHYVVAGHIENLGLYNRSIVGTWSHDNVKGDFKITRQ